MQKIAIVVVLVIACLLSSRSLPAEASYSDLGLSSVSAWAALKAMMGAEAPSADGDKELIPPTDEIGEALFAEREPIQKALAEERYDDANRLAENLLGKLDVAAKMLPRPGRFFDSGKKMRESIEVLLTYIHYDRVAALKRAGRLVEAYVELGRLKSSRRKVQGVSMGSIEVLENCIWTELAVASKFKKIDLLGVKDTSDTETIKAAYERLAKLTDASKYGDVDLDIQLNIRELHNWIEEAYRDVNSD